MATTLKDFKFNLANVSTDGSQFDSNKASVISGTGANTDAYVAGTDNTIVMTGFGTIKGAGTNSDSQVIFTGDANMQSGAYTAIHGNHASIKTFDASKASANLSLTTDLVSVDGGVLKAGSGNDTIDVKNIDVHNISVAGGLGADLFKVGDSAVSVTIGDYSYAEGDKISVANALGIDRIRANEGVLSIGSSDGASVKTSVVNGLSKFAVTAGTTNYDYVGAVDNANVNYTAGKDNLVFVGDGDWGSAVIDASKAANASIKATVKDANITLGGATGASNSVVAGIASSDSSVVVDLGYGNDTVSVASAAALTLNVGREDGSNTLETILDKDDTLKLTPGKISDVLMNVSDKTMLTFGATSIAGALNTSSSNTGAFNVQFGSGEAEKLAYTTNNNNAIEYSKDVRHYLGVTGSKITVASASTDDVVLDMVNYTNGITSVKVTDIDAKANVNITATGNASIEAKSAHDGVEWKFDLTANDTNASNYLDVTNATGVDRIILSDAKGNKDTVAGFKAGEDILVLSDVDKLTEKTFTVNTNGVVLNKSQASIGGALVQNTDIDVILADGTAKKVALTNGSSSVATATQKTTTVINQTAAAAKVEFNIAEATENNAAFVVDMTGTVSNAIDYLGKFTSIDATVGAANALIVGNEAITNIKVTDSADYGAAVWAGEKANAKIDLSAASAAGDIVWTGAKDGASSVTGFDGKDKLYVYGVDGLSKTAVAEGFEIDVNDVVYKTGDASMTFNVGAGTTGNINVMYMDSTAKGGFGYQKVAYTNAVANAVNFTTDVDVYIGTGDAKVSVANDAVAEGQITAINLSNKGAGSVEDGGAYYKGIHNIDASKSAGTFLLIGDNTDGAELIGGVNGNAIWGGGNAGQTMTGSNGAADIFWFGSNDGYDDVANFSTKEGDAVFLYDATSIDAVQITAEGSDAKVVFRDTSCTLTLERVSNIDDVKFMLNNADGGFDYYKYDSKTSAFKKA